ncbi:MAG: hypothetical protein Kow00114_27380 [Kiloniellaceae bacterium]
MTPLEIAAYSYWQHSRRALRAIAAGDADAAADAVHTIGCIGAYAKRPSLARCCEAAATLLRRRALRRFGRVSFYAAYRPLCSAAAPPSVPPGAA